HTTSDRDWSSDVCSSDLCALQNVLLHPGIARPAAAVAACRVHHQLAARFPGVRVELHLAALQPECTMHCMEHIGQREADLTLRQIGSVSCRGCWFTVMGS